MKTIWLACCACGDYGLLQREVEGRDPGAQVLRVGDLDGLLSMARAFPSRRGAAIILARTFEPAAVRETVARLAAEGRAGRVVVLVEDLDPAAIEGLFRAGATEVVAARRVIGDDGAGTCADLSSREPSACDFDTERDARTNASPEYADKRAEETVVPPGRPTPADPSALDGMGPGAPRATGGPRDLHVAVTEHERRDRDPYGDNRRACGEEAPAAERAWVPPTPLDDNDALGYVHGVNMMDELDEVTGFGAETPVHEIDAAPWGACSQAAVCRPAVARAAACPVSGGQSTSCPVTAERPVDQSIRDERQTTCPVPGGQPMDYPAPPGSAAAVTGDLSQVAVPSGFEAAAFPSAGPTSTVPDPFTQTSAPVPREPAAQVPGPRAPLVSVISGAGGCGKSTIVAAMAHAASLLGLRAAVLDLDLMFGNLYDLMGVDGTVDMATLIEPAAAGALSESAIVNAAMRVAPGITLWGPVAAPERAESMARAVELLIDVLRRESDVIFVDTSVFWGDAAAAAVAASDRCLVVGDMAVSSATGAARAIDLACRVGVPRTACTAVFNRFGARGADEDTAMRFELTCALSSKIRIADGGQDLSALMAFGRADEAVGQSSAFATSVREATREMLVELGCAVGPWSDTVTDRVTRTERPRIRLPWKRTEVAR